MPNPQKWFNNQRKAAINRVMNVEEAAAFEGFNHILGKKNVIFSPKHANNKTSDLLIRTPNGNHVLVKTRYSLDEKKIGKVLDSYGKCNVRLEKPARLVILTSTPVTEKVKNMVNEYNKNGSEKIAEIKKSIERTNSKIEFEKKNLLIEAEREELIEQWKKLQYLVNARNGGKKNKERLKENLLMVQDKLISDNNARKRHEDFSQERKDLEKNLNSLHFHQASIAPSAQLGNLLAYKLRSEGDSPEKQRLLKIAKNTLNGSFTLEAEKPVEPVKPRYPSERLTMDVLNFLETGKLSFQYEPLTSKKKTPDFMVSETNGETNNDSSMVVEVKTRLKNRTYQKVKAAYQDAKYEGIKPKLLTVVSYSPVSSELMEKNWADLHGASSSKKMPVVILDSRMLGRAINSKISYTERRMKAGEISEEELSDIKSHGEQLLELINAQKRNTKKDSP